VVALAGADSTPSLMSHRVVSVVRPRQHGGEEPAGDRRTQHDHSDRDDHPPKGQSARTRRRESRPPRSHQPRRRSRAKLSRCHEPAAPVRQGPRRDRPVRQRQRHPPPLPRRRSERAPAPVPSCADRISNTASASMKHAPRAAPDEAGHRAALKQLGGRFHRDRTLRWFFGTRIAPPAERAARYPLRPVRRGVVAATCVPCQQVEVDLVDGPKVAEVLGQTDCSDRRHVPTFPSRAAVGVVRWGPASTVRSCGARSRRSAG
jgi:hypothetical protein